MNNTKTGGPAFPNEGGPGNLWNDKGMTLRDYFAAKAMQGFASDPDWRVDMGPEETARAAYTQADAMLKARDGIA
jgi:hypothetical protein